MGKFFGVLVLGILFVSLIGFASAADIAYVVRNGADSVITGAIAETGYSYDVIDDSDLSRVDWGDYLMLVVGDERFSNEHLIPVGNVKALVMNSYHVDEWKIADYAGSQTSSNYQNGRILIDNLITEGLGDVVQFYDAKSKVLNYLPPPFKRAPGLQNVVATDNSKEYPVVGIINKGAVLYGGGVAGDKIVFFGATETDDWSEESRAMFKGSVRWLIGEDKDGDGWYTGDDCDDNDPEVHPGSDDVYKNCRNDAPIVEDVLDVNVIEGEVVVVEIAAVDPEGDDLVYSVGGGKFVQDGGDESRFVWQTDLDDSGNYDFTAVVSDGEFDVDVDFSVDVDNLNQAPVCSAVPDLVWDEDGIAELNLGDYCSDPDGDFIDYFVEDTSPDQHITVTSGTNGLMSFSVKDDWYGQDWIIFSASDGNFDSYTNQIDLIVEPVNDAPTFSEIPIIEINEDEAAEEYLDLNYYFDDIDSELSFSVSGNVHVAINIDDGLVSFYPEADWFGVEEIVFRVSDGEFDVNSNFVSLNVVDMNEPPVFDALICEDSLLEDEQYTCVVSASDFEGDEFVFSVVDEDGLSCDFEDDVLIYNSERDYYGDGLCVLRVADAEGYSEIAFEVSIANVNDAPEIYDYSPRGFVKILENTAEEFSVMVRDVDEDEVDLEWQLDWVIVGSGLSYDFNQPEGAYEIRVEISDGVLTDEKIWNVAVGDISEFTCSEVGGFEFSEKEICVGEILGVKDSDRCCSVEPEPAFSDVDRCLVRDSGIEIEIKKPDDGDDYNIGDVVGFKVKIENELGEDEDFEVEAHLYDVTEDESLEDKDEDVEIDKGDGETVNFDFMIADDFDDGNEYALFVRVDAGAFCSEDYVRIDVKRERHDVVIRDLVIEKSEIEGYYDLSVDIENKGKEDEKISIFIESKDLNLRESVRIELDAYDGRNSAEEDFLIRIPEAGEYDLRVRLVYDGGEEVVEVGKLVVDSSFEGECCGVLDLSGLELGSGVLSNDVDIDSNGAGFIIPLLGIIILILIVFALFYLHVFWF